MTCFKFKNYFYVLFLSVYFFSSCKKEGNLSSLAGNAVTADTTTKIVVILGSSSAAGSGASTLDSSWASRLKNRFLADGKKSKVINLAVPGFTTYQVLPSDISTKASRPNPAIKHNITMALSYHPGLVILNFPTNDIAYGFTDDETLSNYQTLINLLDSANAKYIITGTQPRNFSDQGRRARLMSFNTVMKAIYGDAMCIYFDKLGDFGGYILPQYSFGDGIHVNDMGHNLIYLAIFNHPYLRSFLKY